MLRVQGKRFEVDRCLKGSRLKPYLVWRRGEPRTKSKPKGKRYLDSGLAIEVSRAEFTNLNGQIRGAIRFLKQNQSKLTRLVEFDGVEIAHLDFGIELWDVFVHCDYLPPDLLKLTGSLGIGIELSHYPLIRKTSKRGTT